MKSSELAKELGIKSSEIVAEVARMRGVVFKKRTTLVNLTPDEAAALRQLIQQDRQPASIPEDGMLPTVQSVAELRSEHTEPVSEQPVDASSDAAPSAMMNPEVVSTPVTAPEVGAELIACPEGAHAFASHPEPDDVTSVSPAEEFSPLGAEDPTDVPAISELPADPEAMVLPGGIAGENTADCAGESAPDTAIEPESAPEQFPTWHGDRHTLETRHLGKSYGKKTAVRNVSFSVQTGEIVGLLGPNGAGKTTTFYMVVGAIKPDHGEILLNGKDLRAMPMYQRALNGLGYLPQEPSIFRKLTVRENLKAVLEIRHKSERKKDDPLDIDEEVQGILEEFSLTEFADRDGYRLSGGERRRTEIARAVVLRPTFLLFDEPFAGIDPIAIIELKKMIIYLKNKGLGILITDHNVRETLSITDRAYIIKDGTVFAAGDPETLVGNREVREAYLGEDFRLS